MHSLTKTFTYSVGKKLVMGATGLFLCLFLVVHLSGNLLLFLPDEGAAFNAYSDFMSHSKLIRLMEIILFLGFCFHIVDGVRLTRENKKARPVPYAVNRQGGASWPSRTMGTSGAILFVFLVVHLNTFFVKHRLLRSEMTMYESVVEAFASPAYSLFYVVAMVLLGLHLNHGFQSAFQSLGFNHRRYTPLIQKFGVGFSVLVPLGFAAMPIYFLLRSLGS